MRRALDAIVSAVVLALGRRRRRRRPSKDAERIVPKLPSDLGAESLVLALLFLTAVFAVGFIVVYAVDSLPDHTQLLGATIGLSLLCLAAALIIVAHRLIVTEELVEPYPPREHPYEQELVAKLVEESGDRITRKRFFKLGLGAAGGTLGLAAITPALSFGPLFQTKYFRGTPWRKGVRLVDEDFRPYRASDIEEKDFYTAFPEGLSLDAREELGAPVVLVRLPLDQLRLPPRLHGYDAAGILAYSKICTHAGCAISLYRTPLFQPDEPRPALVCPCHYSTFDVADGGSVVFGPAGRPLPMLPLTIDGKGFLRAAGNFDGEVGPGWWGTRIWKPNP
ncbi:MAG TPA: Rieske (2Fe-2S) protein [Gaiellaceae bacterium]|jgi:ubiquinol-cytochrome c reductase iron-sulfur subunit|nr:Rieske (2Fe-2S) protein [Gaiellaceae bacterium]